MLLGFVAYMQVYIHVNALYIYIYIYVYGCYVCFYVLYIQVDVCFMCVCNMLDVFLCVSYKLQCVSVLFVWVFDMCYAHLMCFMYIFMHI